MSSAAPLASKVAEQITRKFRATEDYVFGEVVEIQAASGPSHDRGRNRTGLLPELRGVDTRFQRLADTNWIRPLVAGRLPIRHQVRLGHRWYPDRIRGFPRHAQVAAPNADSTAKHP